jgi:hypothetical protein
MPAAIADPSGFSPGESGSQRMIMDQRQFEIILKPCGWEDVIRARMGARRAPIKAHTYRRKWESFSRPVLLSCGEKNEEFVVKGRHAGRAIVNEHVVGRLGALLEAPVPRIEIIEVPKDLIDAESELGHLVPGLAHGSQWIPDCSDRQWVQASDLKENRSRFGALAVLYGWVRANDHQLIYSNADPRLVHSVDHGHFFPSGPDWRIQDLREAHCCPN